MAAVLAILLHAGFAMLAIEAAPFPATTPAPALQLVVVHRVPSRAALPVPVVDRAVRGDPPATPVRFVARPDVAPVAAADPVPRATTLDDAWAPAVGDPDASRFRPDPFERRPAKLPGGGTPRFRMRPPRSPASAVAGAATLLGLRPPGYDTSPCPRIARNASDLSTSLDPADRAALAHELAMHDAFCR